MKVLDNQPLLDWHFLDGFTGGQPELESKLLDLFRLQVAQDLAALEAATTEESWREARHSLKSTASSIGARRLADAAEFASVIPAPIDKPAILRRLQYVVDDTLAACCGRIR